MLKILILLLLLSLTGCNKIRLSASKIIPGFMKPSVEIESAVTETIGTCSFTQAPDPYNSTNFSFKIGFSEPIDPTTFDLTDITNTGTGVVTWALQNCGDDTNFKLTATAITTDGTIVPEITENVIKDKEGEDNEAFVATDNSITIDQQAPAVTIEQAITETVGSCSFAATSEPASLSGFGYRVTFSEPINTTSFTTTDISNSGTGGSSITWTITNCGDDRNFSLIAAGVVGNGTIIPDLPAGRVQDPAGNSNTISTSVDNSISFMAAGWVQEAYIKASNADDGDYFGEHVSIDNDTLVVSTPYEKSAQNTITNGPTASADNSSWNAGAAYVYKRTGVNWIQEAYIKSSNIDSYDGFGGAMQIDKDTIAISAQSEASNQTTITNGPTASTNNSNSGSGAVYVYKRTGSTWAQEAYIKALNNVGNNNFFGRYLSLSGDSLAVTSPYDDSNQTTITNGATASSDTSYQRSGAVFIYRRTGAIWAQEAYIKAFNSFPDSESAQAVSISGDTVAVASIRESSSATTVTNGAVFEFDNKRKNSGAVIVYKRTGNFWAQEAFIKAPNADASDYFGYDVSLSGDVLAVTATGEDSNQTTISSGATASADNSASGSGAVYIFKRTANVWAMEAYIKPSNPNSGTGDIELNGNLLVVGAAGDSSNLTTITNGPTSSNDTSSPDSGAVFVYERGASGWTQMAYIKAVNADAGDYFGSNVAVSGDTIAVGASAESSNLTSITNGDTASADNSVSSGAVYVYRFGQKLFETSRITQIASTTNSIQLSWSTAGLKASGYKIAYTSGATPPANCSSGTVIDVGNVLNYNVSSLPATGQYSFRICSYDSSGNTSLGQTITFGTQTASPEVNSLASAPAGLTSATINWVSGGGTTSGYKLAWTLGSTPPADCSSGTVVDVGGGTTYTITGLPYRGTVGVRVCSYDSAAQVSIGRYITARVRTAPEPTNLRITSSSTTSATVRWVSGGGATTGFRVAWATGTVAPADCQSGTNVDAGNVVSYAITGQAAGTIISVRVCSYEVSGSDFSRGVTVTGYVNNLGWNQEAYIKAVNADAQDNFGLSVSISGDLLAVTSMEDSNQTTITNGTTASLNNSAWDSGAVYIYVRTGVNWVQEAYIKAANAGQQDNFGSSISLNRDRLAVGAPNEASNVTTITNGTTASINNSNFGAGGVYVYKRTGSTWAQEAFIKASNNNAQDNFGWSVSLHGDTLAVGAPAEDSSQTTITNGSGAASTDNSLSDSGATYIYRRTGTTWDQEAYIKASNADSGDSFGYAVSIHQDTLAIGAFREDSTDTIITNGSTASSDDSGYNTGAVYVYRRSGVSWAQEAFIKPSNPDDDDRFGANLIVEGNVLVVGAPYEASDETTITNGAMASADNSYYQSGAIYIFERTGLNWAPTAYIKPSNNHEEFLFGNALDLSGNTLAVGTDHDQSNQITITNGPTASLDTSTYEAGAVFVYARTGSTWAPEAYIKAFNADEFDKFGASVSIDGDSIAVGAVNESSQETSIVNGTSVAAYDNYKALSGAVYVYRNNARLFEVGDFWVTPASNSIQLDWIKSGGTATTYIVTFASGLTPPADCNSGTITDVGNIATYTQTGLTPSTTYSFRICSDDGAVSSEGVTLTTTTLP